MNKILSAVSGLLVTLLTACGGGGLSTKMDVVMTDFQYTPNRFTVPAGQPITLVLSNNGAVEHTFVIMKFGTAVGGSFGPEDEANIYWEVKLKPGESKSETFTAPSGPGEYQVVCGIPGHFEAGMLGRLIVK